MISLSRNVGCKILPLGRNNTYIVYLSWIAIDSGLFKENQYTINWKIYLIIIFFPLVFIDQKPKNNISNVTTDMSTQSFWKQKAILFFHRTCLFETKTTDIRQFAFRFSYYSPIPSQTKSRTLGLVWTVNGDFTRCLTSSFIAHFFRSCSGSNIFFALSVDFCLLLSSVPSL